MGDQPKPTGADDMLEPGAWPEASESRFQQVAQDCVNTLQNLVNNGSRPWDAKQRDTFRNGGGIWSGDTAGAAGEKGSKLLGQFTEMQHALTNAANWNYDIASAIAGAKSKIINNVSAAISYINSLASDDPDYDTLVSNRKKQCYKANLGIVADAAAGIAAPAAYKPAMSEQDLLTNGLPPLPSASQPPAPASPPTVGRDGGGPASGTQQPETKPNVPGSPAPGNGPAAPSSSGRDTDGGPQSDTQQPETKPLTTVTPPPAAAHPGTPTVREAPGNPASAIQPGMDAPLPQSPAPGASAPTPGNVSGGGTVTGPLQPGVRPANSTSTGGGTATTTGAGSGTSAGGIGSTTSGSGTPQSSNPSGQPTGSQTPAGQPNNPLQQGLQQFGQGLQNAAGQAPQPLASAQPATPQPTTPPPATPTGAAGGTSGTSAAPVGAASAAGGGGSIGGPATGTPAAPAAPLGPAPTPSPAAPVAQPGQGGPVGPTGPGVAAAGTNNQQAAAAAAPIPVSPARAERDAMAAAAKAGLLQRKSAGNTDADVEIARRISAALHAPPSIPAASYQFMWAVGVTSEGQILAANSYGIGYIPDGVKLPGQVTLVSADEAIPPAERGRWVNVPFLALQGWAQFHGKTLRAIIGTPDEVKPYKSSMHAEELAPDDIPADGTMQGRSRLQVIAPEAAARLEEWSDVTLYEALPPRPVQDAPPDAKQTMKLWVETIKPLLRTTGTNGPIDHLIKLIAYADHMQSIELYKAYTAPHVAAQREAMSDWIYWQHVSSICQDATNPVLGSVQA